MFPKQWQKLQAARTAEERVSMQQFAEKEYLQRCLWTSLPVEVALQATAQLERMAPVHESDLPAGAFQDDLFKRLAVGPNADVAKAIAAERGVSELEGFATAAAITMFTSGLWNRKELVAYFRSSVLGEKHPDALVQRDLVRSWQAAEKSLNNNFKDIADQFNDLLVALRSNGTLKV